MPKPQKPKTAKGPKKRHEQTTIDPASSANRLSMFVKATKEKPI